MLSSSGCSFTELKMTKENWQPDPAILEQLRKDVKKQSKELRVGVGTKIMTWEDVIKEVEAGTNLGRRYYNIYVESIKRQ